MAQVLVLISPVLETWQEVFLAAVSLCPECCTHMSVNQWVEDTEIMCQILAWPSLDIGHFRKDNEQMHTNPKAQQYVVAGILSQ